MIPRARSAPGPIQRLVLRPIAREACIAAFLAVLFAAFGVSDLRDDPRHAVLELAAAAVFLRSVVSHARSHSAIARGLLPGAGKAKAPSDDPLPDDRPGPGRDPARPAAPADGQDP